MNQAMVSSWFQKWSELIKIDKIYMSDLDNAIGDGDHGFNMSKGVCAYLEIRSSKQIASITDELKLMGMTLLSKVGGASGPLYGSAFLAMTKFVADKTDLTPDEIADMLQAGLDSIMLRGKATYGEKTMVDFWVPAIKQFRQGQLTEASINELVEATKPTKATKGRASYLGDRSIGHIDPGSYSSGLLFKTLLEVVNFQESE